MLLIIQKKKKSNQKKPPTKKSTNRWIFVRQQAGTSFIKHLSLTKLLLSIKHLSSTKKTGKNRKKKQPEKKKTGKKRHQPLGFRASAGWRRPSCRLPRGMCWGDCPAPLPRCGRAPPPPQTLWVLQNNIYIKLYKLIQ